MKQLLVAGKKGAAKKLQLDLDKKKKDVKCRYHVLVKSLEKKIRKVPFLDDIDLRYNLHTKQPVPTSKAVMFCIMDVLTVFFLLCVCVFTFLLDDG